MPEDGEECEFFAIILLILYIFIKTSITCKYLDKCAYKIVYKQMTDYLDPLFLGLSFLC